MLRIRQLETSTGEQMYLSDQSYLYTSSRILKKFHRKWNEKFTLLQKGGAVIRSIFMIYFYQEHLEGPTYMHRCFQKGMWRNYIGALHEDEGLVCCVNLLLNHIVMYR